MDFYQFYTMYFRFFVALLFLVTSTFNSMAQNSCETIVTASLQKLPPVLIKNDFDQIKRIIQSIRATCEDNELALRLEITQQLLLRENTSHSIAQYLEKGYDQILIQRFDDAVSKSANRAYLSNKAKYQYFPLNHTVDSLLKVKAKALIRSESYTLNNKETAIVYLFADYIDDFYSELNKKPQNRPVIDKIREREKLKGAPTIGLLSGIFVPLEKASAYQTAPSLGFSVMGPFSSNFVPELTYRFRVHNAVPFDMKYKDEIREVSPRSSHFLGLGIGYKIYDSGKFIVLPKINSGLGFIWTGLSESYYEEDDYGNEERNTAFKNINTWQNSLGITSMFHLRRKTYIGLEANYHVIPYHWDAKLKSSIPIHYASLEFFVRF